MSDPKDSPGEYFVHPKLGELFQQSHERGRTGLPIVSLTMDRGLLPRDQIDRRVETNLPPEGHRLVRKGELAYNMMRMWQGVCHLATYDCITSPAYVVLRPEKHIDPKFAEYFLRFENTVAEFRRLSFGVVDDRLRLYYDDFCRVEAAIPHLKTHQIKIATILLTLDKLIQRTRLLIAKYQEVKQGLMQALFCRGLDEQDQLRPCRSDESHLYHLLEQGWVPKQWEPTTVGAELLAIEAGKSPDCPDSPAKIGEWGVLKVSAVQPEGFLSAENKVVVNRAFVNPSFEVRHGDLLISRSNTSELVGAVCLVENPQHRLMLCDKTLRLKFDPRRVVTEFMFWLLQQAPARRHVEIHATGTSGSMKNIGQTAIKSLRIALPPKDEQSRIDHRLRGIQNCISTQRRVVLKLLAKKAGLIQDLLLGRVRPVVAESEDANLV